MNCAVSFAELQAPEMLKRLLHPFALRFTKTVAWGELRPKQFLTSGFKRDCFQPIIFNIIHGVKLRLEGEAHNRQLMKFLSPRLHPKQMET
jgi:hypothetical protein